MGMSATSKAADDVEACQLYFLLLVAEETMADA